MRDSASATPSLHPAYLINKLNNYVKELNIILPNGTRVKEKENPANIRKEYELQYSI